MKKLILITLFALVCAPAFTQHVTDTIHQFSGEVSGVVQVRAGTYVAVDLDGSDLWAVYGTPERNADPVKVVSECNILRFKYAAEIFPHMDTWKYVRKSDLK